MSAADVPFLLQPARLGDARQAASTKSDAYARLPKADEITLGRALTGRKEM